MQLVDGARQQVIGQVLAVALDDRRGVREPLQRRLAQLRGTARRGRVLQVGLDALVRGRRVLRRDHHGRVIEPAAVVTYFRHYHVVYGGGYHVSRQRFVRLASALELGQLRKFPEWRRMLLLLEIGQVDGMLYGPALAVRPRSIGRWQVPAAAILL